MRSSTHRPEPAGSSAPRVLLLDFDGTVCVGDGPVRAYAQHLATAVLDVDPTAGRALAESLREGLEAYLDAAATVPPSAGTEAAPPAAGPAGATARAVPADGYAAVAALAAPHASPDQLEAAYAASRENLAADGLGVRAPDGLAALLAELGPDVERVLVTNAPERGVVETLERIGLAGVLDAVVTDARKPAGWAGLLPEYLAGRAPEAVLAVGDVWRNDLATPLAAGCATALVDRFGHRAGPAHVAARTFEDLYPAVRAWACDPHAFVAGHAPVVHDVPPETDPPARHPAGT